jgi:elongation factor 1-gamma
MSAVHTVSIQGFNRPYNMRLWKVAVVAHHCDVPYTLVPLEFNVENLSEHYLRNVHPLGRTPSIQTDEGFVFESTSCLRYFARRTDSLYGKTHFESTQVDMWLDYAAHECESTGAFFIGKFLGVPVTLEEEVKALEKLHESLHGLEIWLETRTWLVGERISIADINLAFTLDWSFRFCPDHEVFTKKYKNVFRHYSTVMNQPKTIECLTAHGAVIGLPKVEKKAAEPAKPKEEAKPKKEEKKPAKEDDEEEEDAPVEEKKKPNPLDSLPPSKLVLDAFKREYSNKDTRKEAAPWFFENYDPEGFSCFWCKYKYNDELTKAFMTSNLVRGWFQRMEHVRKYAFGTVLVIGEESKHEIQGFWVFRGKGLPEIVSEVEDTELYSWTEIPDIKKEQEKITDFLAWDGATFATQPVLEGKTFK